MIVTIQAPVFVLGPAAASGLSGIKEILDTRWDNLVDTFYNKHEDDRWFWIGPFMYPDRESVEEYFGKGNEEEIPATSRVSKYNEIYLKSDQQEMYKNFVDLYKINPTAMVTLPLEDYNVLMSWSKEVEAMAEEYEENIKKAEDAEVEMEGDDASPEAGTSDGSESE